MMKKLKDFQLKLAAITIGLLPLTFSFAAHGAPNNPWFVGVGLGLSWADFANHATVPNGSDAPSPYNVDRYSISNSGTNATESLFAGYRWTRPGIVLPRYSLALRYQHFNTAKVNGTIEQYSLPSQTNYSYHAHASSNVLSLLGKVDLYQYQRFSPYVSAGLGAAYNDVGGYKEQAFSGTVARVSPAYRNNTSTHFMFDFGAGIDFALNQQVALSLGYEFSNLGDARTKSGANDDWDKLSLGTMTSNAVLLSVVYQLPLA